MARPRDPRGKTCAHPGCRVWIRLAEQPRRYAMGLCRAHEADAALVPRDRVRDRPDVRQAVVMGGASNSYGALAVTRVSLVREPWE